jgi:hypothetical protein
MGPGNRTVVITLSIPASRHMPSGSPDGVDCTTGHFGGLDTWWDTELKMTLPIDALNPRRATHFSWSAATTPQKPFKGKYLFATTNSPLQRATTFADNGDSVATVAMYGRLSLTPDTPKHRRHHK